MYNEHAYISEFTHFSYCLKWRHLVNRLPQCITVIHGLTVSVSNQHLKDKRCVCGMWNQGPRYALRRFSLQMGGASPIGFYRAMHFNAERGLAIACRLSVCLSVCLSVTLVICDHICWKSWKLIAQTISPTPSLFVAKRRSTYSQGNMGKFRGD